MRRARETRQASTGERAVSHFSSRRSMLETSSVKTHRWLGKSASRSTRSPCTPDLPRRYSPSADAAPAPSDVRRPRVRHRHERRQLPRVVQRLQPRRSPTEEVLATLPDATAAEVSCWLSDWPAGHSLDQTSDWTPSRKRETLRLARRCKTRRIGPAYTIPIEVSTPSNPTNNGQPLSQ